VDAEHHGFDSIIWEPGSGQKTIATTTSWMVLISMLVWVVKALPFWTIGLALTERQKQRCVLPGLDPEIRAPRLAGKTGGVID
jgi:hypothetical protein